MVLSMLSAIQSVKLPSSNPPPQESNNKTEQDQQQHQQTSASLTRVTSDMSRRKQRNPKPFFVGEDEDHQTESNSNADHEDISKDKSDDEGIDEHMVKVEIHEHGIEAAASATSAASPTRASFTPSPPASRNKSPASCGASSIGRNSPLASTSAASAASRRPQPPLPLPLTGMPPLHLPSSGGAASNPEAMLLAQTTEMLAKQNMFYFGDVAVADHPDAPPVPMVVPMVYLYPLASQNKDQVKYRMFVPFGAGMGPEPLVPPGFPVPPMPAQSAASAVSPPNPLTAGGLALNLPKLEPKSKASVLQPQQDENQPPRSRSEASPLDLSKSPDKDSEDEAILPDQKQMPPLRRASLSLVQKAAEQQNPDLEAQLQFLKAKQLEFIKNQHKQAAMAAAAAAASAASAVASKSRCEECNINFSKHQNYIAHKKYYCSASASKAANPPAPILSDDEDTSKSAEDAKSQRRLSPPTSVTSPSAALSIFAAAGLASPKDRPSPGGKMSEVEAAAAAKEMLLLKQQELINKELLKNSSSSVNNGEGGPANDRPPKTASASSASSAGHPPPSSASINPAAAAFLLSPAAAANAAAAAALSHFVCEGCGIKFKSVSNLQAHQARYCAGLRKAEEMSALEAMFKQSRSALTANPKVPAAASAASHLPMLEMMNLLNNAKSLHEQEKLSSVMMSSLAAAAAAASSINATAPPPPATSPAASNTNGASTASTNEDYCCILCGYKEQSVERLKDHINLHFIGQVKRKAGSEDSAISKDEAAALTTAGARTPPSSGRKTASPSKSNGSSTEASGEPASKRLKIKEEDELEADKDKDVKSEESSPTEKLSTSESKQELRCVPCDIGFSQLSNFVAHKKYYCRGAPASAASAAQLTGLTTSNVKSPAD